MASSSSYTQAQLDALNSAIAQGVKEVRYDDKLIVYRDLAEMLRLRSVMRQELGLEAKGISKTQLTFSKGF